MNLPDDFAASLPGSPFYAGRNTSAAALERAADQLDTTGNNLTARLIAAADKMRERADENAIGEGMVGDVDRAMAALVAALAKLESAI